MTIDRQSLLQQLSAAAKDENAGGLLRATEAVVSLLKCRTALPKAAEWFLETRTAQGKPKTEDDFWYSHITSKAAEELRALLPRIVVLFAEQRSCPLVGNSSAMWAYAALAIFPEPPEDSFHAESLAQLFTDVLFCQQPYEQRPSRICFRAFRDVPREAIAVRFEHELPDARLGHSMMSLDIDLDQVVLYWPQLDDAESNFIDEESLAETCERLGLRHVLPRQLAAFFSVLSYATTDDPKTWGGENGLFFFEPGNLPFVLKHLPDAE